MGFPRQEYWSGLPFPSPGDLPDPGIKPESIALAGEFSTFWGSWTRAYAFYKILSWPSPFRVFCKMLGNSLKGLFGQPNMSTRRSVNVCNCLLGLTRKKFQWFSWLQVGKKIPSGCILSGILSLLTYRCLSVTSPATLA